MALSRSQLYPNARHLFATKQLSWLLGNYRFLILGVSYNPNFANKFLTDIDPSQIIATSPAITNPSETGGLCTGDTVNFGLITSPLLAGSVILYQDTGTPATSPLIAFFDTPDLPGLPISLNGFVFFLYKNLTAGGWFRL